MDVPQIQNTAEVLDQNLTGNNDPFTIADLASHVLLVLHFMHYRSSTELRRTAIQALEALLSPILNKVCGNISINLSLLCSIFIEFCFFCSLIQS